MMLLDICEIEIQGREGGGSFHRLRGHNMEAVRS